MSEVKLLEAVVDSILSFDSKRIVNATKKALAANLDPLDIIDNGLAKGLRIVGKKFESGEFYLAHIVAAAEPVQKVIRELLAPEIVKKRRERRSLGKVVMGTVAGDLHDIGKNIVAAMLFASGFEVYDLGKDAPVNDFVRKMREVDADVVGASALLSTTLPVQREIVEAVKEAGLRRRVKLIFGGAPVTEEWVREIGGDGYADNAFEAVKVVKRLLGVKE